MAAVDFDPSVGRFNVGRGTIHPADKAAFYSQFKVFPNEITGDLLLPFAPKAAEVDQEEDGRLESLAKLVSETATTQAVATAMMELEPWDFMAVYFTGIDHFSHGFMHYHPPRIPNVPEKDFELFKDVVVGAYRFHDMILDRLLQLAGPETSGHPALGSHDFQSRRKLRPICRNSPRNRPDPPSGIAASAFLWQRGRGSKDGRADLRKPACSRFYRPDDSHAPTALPVGEDMDGRALVQETKEPPEVKKIPSWGRDVPGEFGADPAREMHINPAARSGELMQQFVALGYIDDPGHDKACEQAESAELEAKYNHGSELSVAKENRAGDSASGGIGPPGCVGIAFHHATGHRLS